MLGGITTSSFMSHLIGETTLLDWQWEMHNTQEPICRGKCEEIANRTTSQIIRTRYYSITLPFIVHWKMRESLAASFFSKREKVSGDTISEDFATIMSPSTSNFSQAWQLYPRSAQHLEYSPPSPPGQRPHYFAQECQDGGSANQHTTYFIWCDWASDNYINNGGAT